MSNNTRSAPRIDLVVQLGLVRMPTMVGTTRAEAYMPRLCLWVDASSGMVISFEMCEPRDDYLPVVLKSLQDLYKRFGGFPREIQLRDPQLAIQLKELLDEIGVVTVVRESLPMLDEALESFSNMGTLGQHKPEPGILELPGMTLDHLIAFADAGETFYKARPWRHLIDDDLIEIESPAGPKGTRFTQVLGAGGQTFGLGFVGKRQQHEDLRTNGTLPHGGAWSLLFSTLDGIPFPDGEAWERHNLPVAAPDAYPAFAHFSKSKGFSYSTPEQLIWAEGLLRAIAATTEEELDAGRWEKQVKTFAGSKTFKFTLPILLEQMSDKAEVDPARLMLSRSMMSESMRRALDQQIKAAGATTLGEIERVMQSVQGKALEFVPTTPTEQAQALCYEAQEARGRRQVQLARQALTIDPDCCDAMLILAERISDANESLPLNRRAMEAATRQLGEEYIEKNAGHFWGLVETRPYMRARGELALNLMNLGKYKEAVPHLRDLLRLNPGDNQGNRYHLAQCLLHANMLDELDELLNADAFHDDASAEWAFTRALLAYHRKGDSPEARQELSEAMKLNPFVPPILTGRAAPPPPSDFFTPGDPSEAAVCVQQLADAWLETPGAIEWLDQRYSSLKRQHKPEKKKRKR